VGTSLSVPNALVVVTDLRGNRYSSRLLSFCLLMLLLSLSIRRSLRFFLLLLILPCLVIGSCISEIPTLFVVSEVITCRHKHRIRCFSKNETCMLKTGSPWGQLCPVN
jgi:hypothetical protein